MEAQKTPDADYWERSVNSRGELLGWFCKVCQDARLRRRLYDLRRHEQTQTHQALVPGYNCELRSNANDGPSTANDLAIDHDLLNLLRSFRRPLPSTSQTTQPEMPRTSTSGIKWQLFQASGDTQPLRTKAQEELKGLFETDAGLEEV